MAVGWCFPLSVRKRVEIMGKSSSRMLKMLVFVVVSVVGLGTVTAFGVSNVEPAPPFSGVVVEKSVFEGEFGEGKRRAHQRLYELRVEQNNSGELDVLHVTRDEWDECDVGDKITFDKEKELYICE